MLKISKEEVMLKKRSILFLEPCEMHKSFSRVNVCRADTKST